VRRVLLLASALQGHGGVPVVNHLLLDALPRLGWEVTVLSLDDFGSIGRFPAGSRLRSRVAFAGAAIRAARKFAPHLVIATHVGVSPVARLAARRGVRSVGSKRGPRVACWLHGVDAWEHMSRQRRWGLAGTDLALTSSQHTLDRFRAAHPGFARLAASPCLLPARHLSGDVRLAEPATSRIVLSVGRLWGRGLAKGQRELIDAWPAVRASHRDWRLVIIGDGDGAAGLRAHAAARGVEGSVEFRGAVDDTALGRAYEDAAVFALPSRGEGFGLVLAEAMAHGLCCIASSADAGAEVVDDGRTGLLVDPDKPEELALALDRLLGDPDLRVRLGAEAQRDASRRFSVAGFESRLAGALALLDAAPVTGRAWSARR
jgi:phosphatidyl-myo-inositol dimannoside synthase